MFKKNLYEFPIATLTEIVVTDVYVGFVRLRFDVRVKLIGGRK